MLPTPLAILASVLLAASTAAAAVQIRNDAPWLDTAGKEITAQGGSVLQVGDTWYLYGFEPTFEPSGKPGIRKAHAYSSKDLVNWKYEAELFSKDAPSRMDVIHNAKTKKFVMLWRIKIMNNYPLPEDQGIGLAVSDSPTGPFTRLPNMVLPDTAGGGDQSVFVDDDGQAYLVYVTWSNLHDLKKTDANQHISIMLLSDDYTAPVKKVAEFRDVRLEAPSLFKRNGKYYFMASGVKGWWSSRPNWAMADKLEGPWPKMQLMNSSTGDLPSADGTQTLKNGYNTQCDFILPVRGTKDTLYLYAGDRYSQFTKEGTGKNIWLPLQFQGEVPILDYFPVWTLDAAQGTWQQ